MCVLFIISCFCLLFAYFKSQYIIIPTPTCKNDLLFSQNAHGETNTVYCLRRTNSGLCPFKRMQMSDYVVVVGIAICVLREPICH